MKTRVSKNKRQESYKYIFEKFIEYFTGKNFDIVSLPKISGVDCFLYPELHEESAMILMVHRIMQKIFFSAGIRDFSLSDYHNQTTKRFHKIISGVINLARFREETVKTLNKFYEKKILLTFSERKVYFSMFFHSGEIFWCKKFFFYVKNLIREKKTSRNTFILPFLWKKLLPFSDYEKKVNLKKNVMNFEFLEKKKSIYTMRSIFFCLQHSVKFLTKTEISLSLEKVKSYLKKAVKCFKIFEIINSILTNFLTSFKHIHYLTVEYMIKLDKILVHFLSFIDFVFYVSRKIKKIQKKFCIVFLNLKIPLSNKKHSGIKKSRKIKKFFFTLKIFNFQLLSYSELVSSIKF